MTTRTPQEIGEQAQDDFDLGEFIDNGPAAPTQKVRVFTDRAAGLELGGVEKFIERNPLSGLGQENFRTWGIMGKIFDLSRTAELEAENAEKIELLKQEAEVVGARLDLSAIVFELKAVPPFVKKDAKRAARKHLGIHEKVTENHPRLEEYEDEYAAQLLERIVVTMETRRDGKVRKGISIENARKLRGRIDEAEWARLDQKMYEVLWQRNIAEDAVSDADF